MMTEHAELVREIDRLPPKYAREALDFVGYLQQKAQNEHDDGAADKATVAAPEVSASEVSANAAAWRKFRAALKDTEPLPGDDLPPRWSGTRELPL